MGWVHSGRCRFNGGRGGFLMGWVLGGIGGFHRGRGGFKWVGSRW